MILWLPGEEIRGKKIYEFNKRFFDLLFSSLFLIMTAPLFLMIACAIRINSPGPTIFSQQRIGQNRRRADRWPGARVDRRTGPDLKGQPITIYKFRTMVMGTNPYSAKAGDANDERLTVIGRFLRATSLDELPQFINVLKGDLSIVGPRPEMPFIVAQYDPHVAQRLSVKPGITGIWQIYGTRQQLIHENIHYDFEYIRRRSLLLDAWIIIKTVFFVFRVQNI